MLWLTVQLYFWILCDSEKILAKLTFIWGILVVVLEYILK